MTTDLEQRVTARIAARKLCEEIVLLVAGEYRSLVDSHGQAAGEAFWQNFREAFEGHFPQPAEPAAPKPMDDFEARQFGQRMLRYGVHKDKTIDDAPRYYLEWLAHSDDDFKTELKRYLMSERVKHEPREADNDFE